MEYAGKSYPHPSLSSVISAACSHQYRISKSCNFPLFFLCKVSKTCFLVQSFLAWLVLKTSLYYSPLLFLLPLCPSFLLLIRNQKVNSNTRTISSFFPYFADCFALLYRTPSSTTPITIGLIETIVIIWTAFSPGKEKETRLQQTGSPE